MRITLTADEKKTLDANHRTERDRRIADRIKFLIP